MQDETEGGREGYRDESWFDHGDEKSNEDGKQDDEITGGEAIYGEMLDKDEQDENKEAVSGDTNPEDDANVNSDAIGSDKSPDNEYSQYEDFADVLEMAKEYNEQNESYASRELDDVRAKIFLEKVNIDIEAAKKEILKFLRYRHQQYDRLNEMPLEKVSTWILEKEVHERGLALRQRIILKAAGIDGNLMSGIMDDYAHIQEDALDPDGREMRKELKEQMKLLRRDEREELLAQMLLNKTIDDNQYHYLRNEFC